jgi:hypothetical protein
LSAVTLADGSHQTIHPIVAAAEEDVLLRFEVAEKGPRRDVRLTSYLSHSHPIEPSFSVKAHCCLDQGLAGPTLFDFAQPERRLAHILSGADDSHPCYPAPVQTCTTAII